MAIGKNQKRMGKKKGGKRKIVDPMTKKEWYDLRAPAVFSTRTFGKTLVTRSSGLKIASEALKGRVVEVNLADLNKDEDQSYRKMRLRVEDVQGDQCLTNFYGMDFTRDRLCSLIKKWHTLIECWTDVKTTDGYTLRMFAIGFTKRLDPQEKKTSYAKSSQVRAIRKKMAEVMTTEAGKSDIKQLVQKFIPNALGQEIERVCNNIYPLENVYIRKVKVLKTPKFDVTKLMEMHTASEGDKGAQVEREEEEPTEESVAAAAAGGRLA